MYCYHDSSCCSYRWIVCCSLRSCLNRQGSHLAQCFDQLHPWERRIDFAAMALKVVLRLTMSWMGGLRLTFGCRSRHPTFHYLLAEQQAFLSFQTTQSCSQTFPFVNWADLWQLENWFLIKFPSISLLPLSGFSAWGHCAIGWKLSNEWIQHSPIKSE